MKLYNLHSSLSNTVGKDNVIFFLNKKMYLKKYMEFIYISGGFFFHSLCGSSTCDVTYAKRSGFMFLNYT